MLVIEGKLGSGESTLARYYNDNLLHPSKGDVVAKFFYSYRNGERERNHSTMYQALLYEILLVDQTFFIHFQSPYRYLSALSNEESRLITWPRHLLTQILRNCTNHPLPRTIYLLVDALDESDDDGRSDMVRFFWNLAHPEGLDRKCMVNIFFSYSAYQ
jgi:hypothetical protein